MAFNRLAGALMCAGATLGLVGSSLFLTILSLLSWVSFGLIFIFGVKVVRDERPTFAVATLWFATVGGLSPFWIVGLFTSIGTSPFPSLALLLGTALSIAGAGLKLTEWQLGPTRPPPPKLFERAAWLLAAGSLALLVGAVSTYPGPTLTGWNGWIWRTAFAVVGMWLHFLAWMTLFSATMNGFSVGARSRTLNWGRLAWTVSVISFIVTLFAIVATPSLPPFDRIWFPLFFPFLAPVYVPYHPVVFAPVVLAHGFIFHGYSRFLPDGVARKIVRAGVIALVAASTLGLAGLLAAFALVGLPYEAYWWIFMPFPAGSTAIGYGLVFFAWRRGTHADWYGLSGPTDEERTVVQVPPGLKV